MGRFTTPTECHCRSRRCGLTRQQWPPRRQPIASVRRQMPSSSRCASRCATWGRACWCSAPRRPSARSLPRRSPRQAQCRWRSRWGRISSSGSSRRSRSRQIAIWSKPSAAAQALHVPSTQRHHPLALPPAHSSRPVWPRARHRHGRHTHATAHATTVLTHGAVRAGFHHAGLSDGEKGVIEWAFEQGALKLLTATTSLGAGVNLPVLRVVLRSHHMGSGRIGPVSYRQMAGRAGRAGFETKGARQLHRPRPPLGSPV